MRPSNSPSSRAIPTVRGRALGQRLAGEPFQHPHQTTRRSRRSGKPFGDDCMTCGTARPAVRRRSRTATCISTRPRSQPSRHDLENVLLAGGCGQAEVVVELARQRMAMPGSPKARVAISAASSAVKRRERAVEICTFHFNGVGALVELAEAYFNLCRPWRVD
jgi:hypothetical protein